MDKRDFAAREYTAADLLRLARRVRNSRRGYLFVNPLQAKHIPVSPGAALALMRALGGRIARRVRDVRAVIGFAETATAIGACAASVAGQDVFYVQTTRETERFDEDDEWWIDFVEAHSHAVEQRLHSRGLLEALRAQPGSMVLVDDEISTGRTCLDLLAHLKDAAHGSRQDVLIASLLSSCTPEDLGRLAAHGVDITSLVVLDGRDYEREAASFDVTAPEAPDAVTLTAELLSRFRLRRIPDARLGVRSADYEASLDAMCEEAQHALADLLPGAKSILLVGTEECMYPALRLGEYLEQRTAAAVSCHATTRSPIGICADAGYPIGKGHRVRSFYDEHRPTYIYNEGTCDLMIVVTDTHADSEPAMRDILRVFTAKHAALLEV